MVTPLCRASLVVFSALLIASAVEASWPQVCYDCALTNCNSNIFMTDTLVLEWSFPACRILPWTAVLDNFGNCFFADACETLYCVDAHGELVWNTTGPDPRVYEIFCGCALDEFDNRLFVTVNRSKMGDASVRSRIYCFDPTNGDTLWLVNLAPDDMLTPPTVLANGIFVVGVWNGTAGKGVQCYDEMGNRQWVYKIDSPYNSKISADHRNNIYFVAQGTLHSLTRDGNLRWKKKCPGAKTPVVIEDGPDTCIYLPVKDRLVCVQLDNGDTLWTCQVGETIGNVPTYLGKGRVVIGAYNGKVYCIGGEGEVLWSSSVWYKTGLGAFAVGGGRIYGGSQKLQSGPAGVLFSLDYSGNVKWSKFTDWMELDLYTIVDQGRVIFPSNSSCLLSYRIIYAQ